MALIVKIVVPVVVALAAIWGYVTYVSPAPQEAYAPPVVQENQPAQPAPAQDPAAQISASGSSDAALDADLTSIDTQLKAASDSSAAASASDTPVDTAY